MFGISAGLGKVRIARFHQRILGSVRELPLQGSIAGLAPVILLLRAFTAILVRTVTHGCSFPATIILQRREANRVIFLASKEGRHAPHFSIHPRNLVSQPAGVEQNRPSGASHGTCPLPSRLHPRSADSKLPSPGSPARPALAARKVAWASPRSSSRGLARSEVFQSYWIRPAKRANSRHFHEHSTSANPISRSQFN